MQHDTSRGVSLEITASVRRQEADGERRLDETVSAVEASGQEIKLVTQQESADCEPGERSRLTVEACTA